MKFGIKRTPSLPPRTYSFVGWSGSFLQIVGVLTLGCVGFALVDAKLFQAYESRRFDKQLEETMGPSTGNGGPLFRLYPSNSLEAVSTTSERPGMRADGSPLGRIEIETIGLTAMILAGTGDETLRRAVGHISGTSLPGREGNVAIAGHRDTFFRPLRNIRENDEITLTTLDGSYRYRVESTRVVGPEDTTVLDDSDEAILTLVTCYPFNFVGSAPRRFIVRAQLIP
jgi:sortase A